MTDTLLGGTAAGSSSSGGTTGSGGAASSFGGGSGGAAVGAPVPKPDFLELLIQALATRVKDMILSDLNNHIRNEVKNQISDIDASDIDDLDDFVDKAIENYDGNRRIGADDIRDLDDAIKAVLIDATLSIDL